MTLMEAKVVFLRDKRLEDSSPDTTLNTYSSNIDQFIKIIGNKELQTLSRGDIKIYHQWLDDTGKMPKTIRNKIATVRSLVRYLYVEDLLEFKPEKIKIPKQPRPNANFLTQEEAEDMLNICVNVRDRAMLLVFLRTGVRVSEFVNLKLHDMHRRTLLIEAGKGDKPRVVFINKETERAIKDYIKLYRGFDPGPLFPNQSGLPLSRQFVSRVITKYAAEAGIKKDVSAHTMRHTFATGYLENGGRLEELQLILGHANIRETTIYLHFTNERLHKSYDEVYV